MRIEAGAQIIQTHHVWTPTGWMHMYKSRNRVLRCKFVLVLLAKTAFLEDDSVA